MNCTMRISGRGLNLGAVRRFELLKPYRIELKGIGNAKFDCLYYDVTSMNDGDDVAFVAAIELWLLENTKFLRTLRKQESIEFKGLDIILTLKDPAVRVGLDLRPSIVKLLSDLDLSVTISTHRAIPTPARGRS